MRCKQARLASAAAAAAANALPVEHASLNVLRVVSYFQAVSTGQNQGGTGGGGAADSRAFFAAGVATAAVTVGSLGTLCWADANQDTAAPGNGSSSSIGSWFGRLTGSSSTSRAQQATAAGTPEQQQQQQPGPSPASGTAAWQQQQQQQWPGGSSSSVEPLSGAIPLLTEDGLTNHPLDYNPITNEHTAAMTLAKQSGIEAYQAGRYAEAERRFKEAVEEAKLGFPPSDPHIPSALHYLAEFYRNTRKHDQAHALYQEVLSHLLENLGDKHWMYAAALCSLAALHEAQGEYEQARALLETALELRRQVFSAGSYMYADTASNLAAVLLKQYKAASASSSSSGGGGGGWFGRQAPTAPPDVVRAIELYNAAITVVEEAGQIAGTPVAAWLVDLASAQQILGQNQEAVASLRKALEYMATPPLGENSSSSEAAGNSDPAVAAAAMGSEDAAAARLRIMAHGSEVAERLMAAQLAAADLAGARDTMRAAVEARLVLYGRHLVVAKSMTRLANLLMQEPADPAAPQLAPHFAASAVAIAENALQGAQRAKLWTGMLGGALRVLTGGSSGQTKQQLESERASERLMATLQLGNACLALAAAEQMNGQPAAAEAALRNAVGQLRWVLGVGSDDLARLSRAGTVDAAHLEQLAGLLVDAKLLQLDCLEALAAALQQATPSSSSSKGGSNAKVQGTGSSSSSDDDAATDEVSTLLVEAEALAAELNAD